MYRKFDHRGKKVCCVLSGGNIDVTRVSKVIEKGLYKTNRRMELRINLDDQPGQLTKISGLLEEQGANIVQIYQNVDLVGETIDSMIVSIIIDTKDKDHQGQILTALNQNSYVYKARYNDAQF